MTRGPHWVGWMEGEREVEGERGGGRGNDGGRGEVNGRKKKVAAAYQRLPALM